LEFDLVQLSSEEVLVFHDLNFLEKTGLDLDVDEASYDMIKDLTYLQTLSSVTYTTKPRLPLFRDFIKLVCSINSHINLWLDVKVDVTSSFGKDIFVSFESSSCSCDENQVIIFETYNQYSAITYMRELNKDYRCKIIYAFSTFNSDEIDDLGTWNNDIQTYSTYAEIIDFSTYYIKQMPSLTQITRDSGMCVSIYSDDDKSIFNEYTNINIDITDIDDSSSTTPSTSSSNFSGTSSSPATGSSLINNQNSSDGSFLNGVSGSTSDSTTNVNLTLGSCFNNISSTFLLVLGLIIFR
jgi:hypothetical protein